MLRFRRTTFFPLIKKRTKRQLQEDSLLRQYSFKNLNSLAPISSSNMFDRIVQVVTPVSLCAIYTCTLIRILAWNLSPTQPNILDSTWRRFGINVQIGGASGGESSGFDWPTSLVIVSLICSLIILVTLLIMIILYMGWHRCLVYYFYLPSLIILTCVTPAFARTILQTLNSFVPDIYTVILVCWNFTALGMMAIFGLYAPTGLCLQQFYLIHNSAMLSLLIIHALPGWAPWLLLAFLVMWDLFAVLAPYGPLNMIISMADRVGISEMPGLVYSTTHHQQQNWDSPGQAGRTGETLRENELRQHGTDDTATPSSSPTINVTPGSGVRTIPSGSSPVLENVQEPDIGIVAANKETDNHHRRGPEIDEAERAELEDGSPSEQGLSIGLGDFIFYSLLVGLTSKGRDRADFYTVLASLMAVLFGLVLTLFILALSRRALPALPISVGLGLSVAALTSRFAAPLANDLAAAAIFI